MPDIENIVLPPSWNEWQILEILGQGAFGAVYKAAKNYEGRNAPIYSAIKIIKIPENEAEYKDKLDELGSEEFADQYFQSVAESCTREIRLMDDLKGITNIVMVQDCQTEHAIGTAKWTIYIRMELLTGFNQYRRTHAIDEKEVIRMGIDICNALEYCERLNVIHRDIKPENILVSSLGDYKLGDFGVARKLEGVGSRLSVKVGTYEYMAPEVYRGGYYDKRADIYSLGLVMFRLLNNYRGPFLPADQQIVRPDMFAQARFKRLNGEPIPAPAMASKKMAMIIKKAVAYDMEDRYKSAREMKKDLLKIEVETNSSLGDIAETDSISEQGSIKENNDIRIALREITTVNHTQVGDDLKIESSADSSRIPTQGYATNKKLKKDKKVALYLAPVVCLAAFMGIWILYSGMLKKTGEVPDSDVVVSKTETVPESETNSSGAEATKETVEVTDEEVIEAWNDIYSTLKEMSVEGDAQGIMDLADVSEEEAEYLAQYLADVSFKRYDSQNTYIVWQNDKYYFVETVEYFATGENHDTWTSKGNYNAFMEKKDGEWRIKNTDEMMKEDDGFLETIFGTEYLNAFRAGRNNIRTNIYMFTHPERVLNGCFEEQLISVWQNEDGSMDIQFCAANGTNNARQCKTVHITLTDDTLGTICDIRPVVYWYSIPPGRNKIFTIHVNPSNILTGTSTWGNVSMEVKFNSPDFPSTF